MNEEVNKYSGIWPTLITPIGRYGPFKETGADPDIIRAKLEATGGTSMAVLQAIIPCLLEALAMGTPGTMAIPPNVMPHLHVLVRQGALADEDVTRAHRILCMLNAIIQLAHPRCTKLMLGFAYC